MNYTYAKTVRDYKEISSVISRIKANYGSLISNYYETEAWVTDNIKSERLFLVDNDKTVFLLFKIHTFYKLYYFSCDIISLKNGFEVLNLFDDGVLVCELLDKRNLRQLEYGLLLDVGFLEYARLVRLKKIISQEDLPVDLLDTVRYAELSDVGSIIGLQHKLFNKYVDRFLSKDEVSILIEQKLIFIAKQNDIFSGFLVYDWKEEKSHLRYIAVDKNIAVKGTGNKLLSALYYNVGVGKLLEVWSRTDNEVVTQMYKRKGFIEDGLFDAVFYRNCNSHKIEQLLPLN